MHVLLMLLSERISSFVEEREGARGLTLGWCQKGGGKVQGLGCRTGELRTSGIDL